MPGRSRTLLLYLAAIGGIAGGTATPAAAQTATPTAKVMHACYVPLTGTVYRIKETGLRTACSSSSHVEFSWTDGASADGSFLATGAYAVGLIPASGAGVRMMWYPRYAAFRAGGVSGTEWDYANIGPYSTATGKGTIASAGYATAMGYATTASDGASTAMGYQTTASGYASTAMGYSTTASGFAATAMGNNTVASGGASIAMGRFASTNGHGGAFVFGDQSVSSAVDVVNAVANNQFVVRAQHLWFGTNNSVTATPGRYLETSTGAYLSSGGVWTNVSDVNRKHLFEEVASDDILARLAALPITEWSYKAEDDSVRHIGPTAQDFYSAFHLGSSDTSIGTIDADGVSLLAIQALEKRTRELQSENTQLKSRLDALESAVRAMQHQTEERQP